MYCDKASEGDGKMMTAVSGATTPTTSWTSLANGRCKLALIVLNIIVLFIFIVAIVTYISLNPKLTYVHQDHHHHHHHNLSNSISATPSLDYQHEPSKPTAFSNTTSKTTTGCEPMKNKMCMKHAPYDMYRLPNFLQHKTIEEVNDELAIYAHVVELKCYQLLPIFLCAVFLPKCTSPASTPIPPCRALCIKARRRCEFFMSVYQVKWPDGFDCDQLPESPDSTVCIGQLQFIQQVNQSRQCPNGMLCDDGSTCVENRWKCDGNEDCQDGADEKNCPMCGEDELSCGSGEGDANGHGSKCVARNRVCDGFVDCPNNSDEMHCYRLQGGKMRDETGQGHLQAYDSTSNEWLPVCPHAFDHFKQAIICKSLGYRKRLSVELKRLNSSDDLAVASQSPRRILHVEWMAEEKSLTIVRNISDRMTKVKCESTIEDVHLECTDIECGRSILRHGGHQTGGRRKERIVGGSEVSPGTWPWLVGLHGGVERVFFCAGVLISDSWVMSSGHCIGHQNDTSGLSVVIGATRRSTYSRHSQTRNIRGLVKHPEFVSDATKLDNDIVLLQLDEPVSYNPHVAPACLPSARVQPGTICTMIGWGKSNEGYDKDYMLAVNSVQLPILSHETCRMWYSAKYYTLTDSMLCAGYEEGGKDACQGDSGGPLLCRDSLDRWYVAGLASWGYGCAQPFYPGVYTNVHKFLPWIKQIISDS